VADAFLLAAIGLPAIAMATFALYMIAARNRVALLRSRPATWVVAGVLAILGGALTAIVGLTSGEAGVLAAGLLAMGTGIALSSGAGLALMRAYEKELSSSQSLADDAKQGRAELDAIARAAEATGVGLMLVGVSEDGGYRITFCNRPAAALLGQSEEEIKGKTLDSLLAHAERATLLNLASRASARPGEPIAAGFTLAPNSEGAPGVPVELGLTFKAEGGRTAVAVTIVDARPKRTAIAAARDARSDADFYLDLVTHDLSNFNQGALGYLELVDLNKDAPPEKIRRFEANALRQIRNSARLIENVKFLSVIREAREPLAPVDALYALHDAIDHTVFSWTEKDVEVRLVPMTALHMVKADGWLRDLFSHLIDNAVKFSPQKRVEVAISVAEGASGDSLVFRIADRGRGISPEEREVILDRLGSRNRDYAAYRSGIGLFIVKTITDRYGGRLWIEERVPGDHKQGSVFCLELPRA
jgi:signal transduction histidine kinase